MERGKKMGKLRVAGGKWARGRTRGTERERDSGDCGKVSKVIGWIRVL